MALNIRANIAVDRVVNSRVTPELKKYANTRLYAYCDAYVPYDTGLLSRNVRITDETIHYVQEYAAHAYTGDYLNFKTDHHPLATAYWDRAAMTAKYDNLVRDITNYVNRGGGENSW